MATIMPEMIKKYENEILDDWISEQLAASTLRSDLLREDELRAQSAEFLALFQVATQKKQLGDITTGEWRPVREMLGRVSRSRAEKGFSPAETATFILSLKQPVFTRLGTELGTDAKRFQAEVWEATMLLDKLGLFTIEAFLKVREEIIIRQRKELLELSTPVVQLWKGILALPLIGMLDSSRTQVVMENLLKEIVRSGSRIAIIDITGVPTVDTQTAQHLLKTASATRLMGTECVISGIRPEIAQTIVQLGIDMSMVTTRASLADAFAHALRQSGLLVSRAKETP